MLANQDIRFRVSLDDSGIPASAQRTAAGLQQIGKSAQAANGAMLAFGAGGKVTAQQLQALSYQTTDIVTSLVGGQSPFLVLLQQGGQLRDQFGGVGNVFQAVAQTFTVARVATLGVVGAVGALAYAFVEGNARVDQFNRALALNGNAAGVTRGRIDEMAASIDAISQRGVPAAREALMSLAASGAFSGEQMELAGRATLALSKLSGQTADEVAKNLAGMASGVADWAAQANRSYNFLTPEVYRHIKALEEQGRRNDAITLTLRELAPVMEQRIPAAAGYLEQALNAVTGAAGRMWGALLNWGVPETMEQQLASVTSKVKALQRELSDSDNSDPRRNARVLGEISRLQQIAGEKQQIIAGERKAAEAQAETARKNQAEIDAINRKGSDSARRSADAVLGLQAAQQAKSLALLELGGRSKATELERQYRQFEISAAEYENGIIQIERNAAKAREDAARADIARQQQRPSTDAAGEVQKRTAIIQAEIKLQRAIADRGKLEADIAAGKYNAAAREVTESPAAAFRQAEARATADVAKQWAERLGQARTGAAALVAETRSLSVQLISDDRARGQRQIELEEDQMRRRIDLGVLSVDERMRIEDEFAQWRVLREQQLTEQLKPQWQRDAELWADTTRYMADRYNEFIGGFVDTGREAFATFAREGRISTRSLAQFIRAEFARMAYERFLAGYVQKAADFLFSALLGGGGGGGPLGGAGGQNPTGGLANGGYAAPGHAYMVGERGPELLVMGRSGGAIVPNSAISSGNGGPQVVVQQTINLQGGDAGNPGAVQRLLAGVRQSAIAGVAEARARGNPAFT